MRYDTERYSLQLEIVFTFKCHSWWSTFLSKMCWLHDNAQVRAIHFAVTESVSLKSFFQIATADTKIIWLTLAGIWHWQLACRWTWKHDISCDAIIVIYLSVFILLLLLFDLDIIIARIRPKYACSVDNFGREWPECTTRKFLQWAEQKYTEITNRRSLIARLVI